MKRVDTIAEFRNRINGQRETHRGPLSRRRPARRHLHRRARRLLSPQEARPQVAEPGSEGERTTVMTRPGQPHPGKSGKVVHHTFEASRSHGDDVTGIRLGSMVMLRNEETGEVESHVLVADAEANPRWGLPSVESPLGAALVGRQEGGLARVGSAGASHPFEILEVDQRGAIRSARRDQ